MITIIILVNIIYYYHYWAISFHNYKEFGHIIIIIVIVDITYYALCIMYYM